MTMTALATNPILHGAIAGAVAAAAVDFHAFATWKSVNDLLTYSWSVAVFRWFQGAVVGAVAAAGMGALVS